MPDDDDRPRDATGAADSNWPVGAKGGIDWAQISAPDDISSLSRDVKAYHRECRSLRRRESFHRLSARPSTAPLTMTATALVMAAIVALLLTIMAPSHTGNGPSALPVAKPAIATGQIGGLLPSVPLTSTAGKAVGSLTLAPAVLISIPANCPSYCVQLINEIAAQAYAVHQVHTVVVAPAKPDAGADALNGRLTSGRTDLFYDAPGANNLRDGLNAVGVTVTLVDRDATIYNIARSVTPTNVEQVKIADRLHQMLAAKAPTG